MTNFTNGALVFRLWSDGSGEVLAKFQYWDHATDFAQAKAAEPTEASVKFYVAVCDSENWMRAYTTAVPSDNNGAGQ